MQLVTSAIMGLFIRLRTERGQDLLEYAMLGGLIAGALFTVGAVGIISGAADGFVNGVKACIDFDAATVCTGGI